MPKKKLPLVDAHVIAAQLGVSRKSVWALLRGIRGYKIIEPLPARPGPDHRNRFLFDQGEVAAWVKRTGFKRAALGRQKVPRDR